MVSAGRVACIFTPFALTVASLVCLILIEVSGWSPSELGYLYFFQANFTDLSVSSASQLDNTTVLTASLAAAKRDGLISNVYQVHLWNYCYSTSSSQDVTTCSERHAEYYFDPVSVFHLNASNATSTPTVSGNNPVSSAVSAAAGNLEKLETEILGKSGADALKAYKGASYWMFIAYEVSFWVTLATIACSVLALFSRVGSFFTWLLSVVSSLFTFAAVLTSTILFPTLVASLNAILHKYGVRLTVGTHALLVAWLAVAFSLAATFFWLFSVCCCSGRSNPHHRSNRGGLLAAEPSAAAAGYGAYGRGRGRGRGMRVEKTGAGYERVSSPFLGHAENQYGDRVPLQQYPAQGAAYEPFRHG